MFKTIADIINIFTNIINTHTDKHRKKISFTLTFRYESDSEK